MIGQAQLKRFKKIGLENQQEPLFFFKIDEKENASIEVYTTRPDTIFGVTFWFCHGASIIEEFIESKHVSAYVKEYKKQKLKEKNLN